MEYLILIIICDELRRASERPWGGEPS